VPACEDDCHFPEVHGTIISLYLIGTYRHFPDAYRTA
jgi:hypothetical protein